MPIRIPLRYSMLASHHAPYVTAIKSMHGDSQWICYRTANYYHIAGNFRGRKQQKVCDFTTTRESFLHENLILGMPYPLCMRSV